MLYGLDCLAPPSDSQARTMLRYGWSFLNVYVGGPYLSGHTPWPNNRVASLATIGFRFLPLYVGQQRTAGMSGDLSFEQGVADGTEATILTGACGFNETTILGLDLEAGNYESDPAGTTAYLEGWVSIVNGAGHPAVLYCDPLTAAALGSPTLVDFTWVSDPIVPGANYRKAPQGLFDPSTPPAWSAWQFAFGATAMSVAFLIPPFTFSLKIFQSKPLWCEVLSTVSFTPRRSSKISNVSMGTIPLDQREPSKFL